MIHLSLDHDISISFVSLRVAIEYVRAIIFTLLSYLLALPIVVLLVVLVIYHIHLLAGISNRVFENNHVNCNENVTGIGSFHNFDEDFL